MADLPEIGSSCVIIYIGVNMKEIARDTYLKKLIDRKGTSFIKIITGIRRCGKSYLLNPLFKNHLLENGASENHIVHVNFENRDNKELLDPDKLLKFIKDKLKDDDQYYALLDEVQLVPDFEAVLNSFLHVNNLDVYVTGSNSKFLSSDIATEFRGRGDVIHMYPLSFAEYYSAVGGDKYEAWQQYYRYGGLPQILEQPNDEAKIDFLRTQRDNVYLNDIIERYDIRKSEGFGVLTEILASSIGSLTNPSKLERTFKSMAGIDLSRHKIEDYLEKLENAFLIEKSRRYDVKGKRYIDTPAKYYFSDMGIRNSFVDFRQTEETHIMESVIYNELRRRGYHVDVGVVETRENNIRKQLEVDFVANRGDRTYYIQSALVIGDLEKRVQEARSLNNINDHFSKIIIAKDAGLPGHERSGIVTINLFDFLLDENILDSYQ